MPGTLGTAAGRGAGSVAAERTITSLRDATPATSNRRARSAPTTTYRVVSGARARSTTWNTVLSVRP